MASMNDVNRAREEGYERGRKDTVQRLRTFTGVSSIAPDLDQPEHRAYPEYLAALTSAHSVAVERAEDALAQIHRLVGEVAAAEEQERQILAGRRRERASKNPFTRVVGRAGDVLLPISREVRALQEELKLQETWHTQCLDRAECFENEASKVARWVDDCMADVEQARTVQQARAEAERLDAEHGERDTSPRWCRVFRHEDFTAKSAERCGAFTFADGLRDVAGADFGYRWRRDVDEQRGINGRWALHYIASTKETFLEFHPRSADSPIWLLGDAIESFDEAMDVFLDLEQHQNERNSLALVLDAYEKIRAVKALSGAR